LIYSLLLLIKKNTSMLASFLMDTRSEKTEEYPTTQDKENTMDGLPAGSMESTTAGEDTPPRQDPCPAGPNRLEYSDLPSPRQAEI
jgi:hypothetical protein